MNSTQPPLPGLGAAGPMPFVEVAGLTFRRHDNDEHLYYDVRANQCYWYVFRPHLTPRMQDLGIKTYWAAHVERGPAVRVLNFACGRLDGSEERGPLYDHTDPPEVDPPLRLLQALVELIRSGQDPFR